MDPQEVILISDDSCDTISAWENVKWEDEHLKRQRKLKIKNQFNLPDCSVNLKRLSRVELEKIRNSLKNPKATTANFQKLSNFVFEEKEKLFELEEVKIEIRELLKKKRKLATSLKKFEL